MAEPAQTIDPSLTLPAAENYATLRDEAVALVTELAGGQWSDMNASEPGLTLLETATYALSDLGYRLAHPLTDLLAPSQANESWQALPDAATALSCLPVSQEDLEKTLADHPLLNSAKLASANNGLYKVLLSPIRVLTTAEETQLKTELWQRFQAQRPLGTRLTKIDVISPTPLKLFPVLELQAGQPVETTLASLLIAWRNELASPPVYRTPQALLAEGQSGDKVFNGPLLQSGVKTNSAEYKNVLLSSELIRLAHTLPGIHRLNQLQYGESASNRKDADWRWPVEPGSSICLDEEHLIAWWSGQIPQPASINSPPLLRDGQQVRANALLLRQALEAQTQPVVTPAIHSPAGRYRQLSDFPALTQDLPSLFGLTASGLSAGDTPARHAQQLQLQAYLLFMEQLLADQSAQLENIRQLLALPAGNWLQTLHTLYSRMLGSELLSVDDCHDFWQAVSSLPPTILRQPVQSVPTLAYLLNEEDRTAYLHQQQASVIESAFSPRWLERTLRRLQHLLARFGETPLDDAVLRYRGVFSHYSPCLLSGPGALPFTESELSTNLVQLKLVLDLAFALLTFPELSSARGQGADIMASLTSRSGAEKRVASRLGMVLQDEKPLSLGNREGLYLIEGTLLINNSNLPEGLNEKLASTVFWVLPAYGSRLGEPSFRRLVDSSIHTETPLHLTPEVIYLSAGQMNKFEILYRHWRAHFRELSEDQHLNDFPEALPAADPSSDIERLRRFIYTSTALRALLLSDEKTIPDPDWEQWRTKIGIHHIQTDFTIGYPTIASRRTVSPSGKINDPDHPYVVAISTPLPLAD
ncbi:hypothetical protein [Iodobacter fluviatilis]|uniref:Uncharacterized protein n=1 Tax=Iodobacter fluviatilis TaxID=537 RepID=A0A7G3GFD0_9NEIS|nr:hypothetical protein [Iodobacter fluviatilis]QBC45948.1 hypothetical protein C1H71_20635 [Iodobacter fluviatilis]